MPDSHLITRLIASASEDLRQMGRCEIAKAHAAGSPGVYSERPGEITTEYPDGTRETRLVRS